MVHKVTPELLAGRSATRSGGSGTRYVVGDWHPDHAKVLEYKDQHLQLVNFAK
jgi:UDP-2,3-diacylglucosamine pyrophosphatase LpxH